MYRTASLFRPGSAKSSVKTFCCKSKSGAWGQVGTSSNNVGSECSPSGSGQCYPTQYKFRCFNTKSDETSSNKPTITEDGEEQCKYVTGVAGKVASTVGNVAIGTGAVVGAVASAPLLFVGGKKYKKATNTVGGKRKSKKQRNKSSRNKRRSTNKRK